MSAKHEYSSVVANAIGLCIQGDVLQAYEYIRRQPDNGEQEEQFVQQLHDRFIIDDPIYAVNSEDPWVRNVVTTYYRYFTEVLTKRMSLNAGKRMLLAELNKIVTADTIETVEEKLKHEFLARGYHFLGGKTQPFWGPYIWKTQESRSFNVTIPSGTEQLMVHFMRDFLMVSWLDFATFGLASTGGWAKDDGLYCVSERYGLIENNPEFEVSLLKHETQHVADYRVFPDLEAKDLEYRAKLVELIYYPTKDKLFEFITQAADNVTNAHAYAAHTIVSRLSQRITPSEVALERHSWEQLSIERLQETALKLLHEHTTDLRSRSNVI